MIERSCYLQLPVYYTGTVGDLPEEVGVFGFATSSASVIK